LQTSKQKGKERKGGKNSYLFCIKIIWDKANRCRSLLISIKLICEKDNWALSSVGFDGPASSAIL